MYQMWNSCSVFLVYCQLHFDGHLDTRILVVSFFERSEATSRSVLLLYPPILHLALVIESDDIDTTWRGDVSEVNAPTYASRLRHRNGVLLRVIGIFQYVVTLPRRVYVISHYDETKMRNWRV